MSACPPTAARKRTLSDFREGPILLQKSVGSTLSAGAEI